jgi:TP901 family phage tail tape measure protein
MAKNEAKIKFSAETGDFNKQIKSANDEMSLLRAELKLNETQMKGTGTTVEGLENKHRILSKELEAAKDKTEALNQKVEKAVEIFGENSTEATKLKTQLANAQNAEEKIKQEVDRCNKELEEQKNVTDKVDKSLEEVEDSAKKASDGFTVMKGVAADLVSAGLSKIAEMGGKVVDAFNEVDEGADNVIKATGATGESAEALTQSFENVSSKIVGDFGDIGSALGEVNTRFGYTGVELEACTEDFLRFSEITGVDSTTAVQSVSRALNDAGIPLDEYGTLLDQLAKAGQSAGIDVTALADSLSANGAVMRSMGFDTAETVALLSQFELSGANTSVMLSGMKKAMANWAAEGKNGNIEFANLVEGVKNGSVTASDAIDVFGTKAGPMLVDAIKSGKFEYNDMLTTIQNSKGTTDSTFDELIDGGYEAELATQNAKLAFAEIGDTVLTTVAPAFDDVVEVIKAMADGFSAAVEWGKEHQGVLVAVASVVGVLTAAITAYNVVQGVKAAMEAANVTTVWALVSAHIAQAAAAAAAVAPYVLIVAAIAAVIAIIVLCVKHWDEIVIAVKNAWEKVKATLSQWGDWISTNVIQPIVKFFTDLWQKLQVIWTNICNVVQTAFMLIGSIISAAVDIITLPFQFIWENCKEYVFSAWEWIKDKVSTAINAVKSVITTVMNAIKTTFTTVWNAVKNTVTTVWNGIVNFITPIVNKIKTTITTAWNAVKSTISTVLNAIKSVVTSVWNSVKSVVTTAVNAIKSKVTSVFNAVKSTVTSIFNGIKSTATSVWNGIKNAIITPIEAAKNKVKSMVDAIKGFFTSMKLELPKIKLPHFSVTGKLSIDPPSVPKLSIEWYKNGGIMTRPTIFGVNGSSLMAGGEAGAEAILPIEKLKDYIADTVESKMNIVNLGALADAVERLADRDINLNINGRNFATATASDSDNVNGLRTSFKGRGLAL